MEMKKVKTGLLIGAIACFCLIAVIDGVQACSKRRK